MENAVQVSQPAQHQLHPGTSGSDRQTALRHLFHPADLEQRLAGLLQLSLSQCR